MLKRLDGHMLPADAWRLFWISLLMAVVVNADLVGWLASNLDPIQASVLFPASFALVATLLRLWWWVKAGVLILTLACVVNWQDDGLYRLAVTVAQGAVVAGWVVEWHQHRRWLSRSLAAVPLAISGTMFGVVWIGGRIFHLLPIEAVGDAGWTFVLGMDGLTVSAACVLILMQGWHAMRWIERSV